MHTYYTIVECLCSPPPLPFRQKPTITLKSYIYIVCKCFSIDVFMQCKGLWYLLIIRVKATKCAK